MPTTRANSIAPSPDQTQAFVQNGAPGVWRVNRWQWGRGIRGEWLRHWTGDRTSDVALALGRRRRDEFVCASPAVCDAAMMLLRGPAAKYQAGNRRFTWVVFALPGGASTITQQVAARYRFKLLADATVMAGRCLALGGQREGVERLSPRTKRLRTCTADAHPQRVARAELRERRRPEAYEAGRTTAAIRPYSPPVKARREMMARRRLRGHAPRGVPAPARSVACKAKCSARP